MKNVYLLPTDKPSRLFKDNSQALNLHTHPVMKGMFTNGIGSNQHIYITSDEKLPYNSDIFHTGAFYHRDAAGDVHIINKDTHYPNPNFCSRIILTTDESLFKYGVQSIDDEFLEWFVKNPSCEEVKVEITRERDGYSSKHKKWYKIIISKEAQKQHLIDIMKGDEELGLYDEQPKQDYSGVHLRHCYQGEYEDGCKYGEDDCPAKPKEEPNPCKDIAINDKATIDVPFHNKHIRFENLTSEQAGYLIQVSEFYQLNSTRRTAVVPKEKPKQETIEEAAEQFEYTNGVYGFKQGVKWQQKRSCSEEDMINFSEWRDKYIDGLFTNKHTTQELLQKWFEKFKKK